MLDIKVYNIKGDEVDTIALNEDVFGIDYNEALIHEVVVAQLANKRQGTKSTLTRSEVRGGGVKPYRQKGTGRARQGSIRAPQWIKGGVVFAPKPRDFSKKVNKFAKAQALASALSEKIRENDVIVLDDFKLNEAKTKEVAGVLKAFNLEKKTLIVTAEYAADIVRAAKNIPTVTTTFVELLNVYELVANGKCLITVDALKKLEEVYA